MNGRYIKAIQIFQVALAENVIEKKGTQCRGDFCKSKVNSKNVSIVTKGITLQKWGQTIGQSFDT